MGTLPHIVEDCAGVLQLYSDGTVFRSMNLDFSWVRVVEDNSVVFKDCLFDKNYSLYLRLYKPAPDVGVSVSTTTPETSKIPVVYYFHGGGFCLGSRSWPNSHICCTRLASGLGALVVAPDYRLAPEHRLPAAIDDALEAVKWLRDQAESLGGLEEGKNGGCDGWLTNCVDFDRVFIVGDSSGGNMAHHLAVRLSNEAAAEELMPVRVRGYILLAPFFGGVDRTRSEEGPSEALLNLEILDRFWRLAMPTGADRDHPLVNPFGPTSPSLERAALGPILAMVGGDELLKDRVHEYTRRLLSMGKAVEYVELEGKQHGFFTNNPYSDIGGQMIELIKEFMLKC
ncbi:hypothetical protein SAY87_009021 [Trapa incisa]|uniref:Alpha/beta hydrolase fold-3 domain-containing protein n=1 Tax=Trapa incisa TaxID=236973 RepID=A0AAN7JYW2_9MYRT|nr:hypothetical protein SAY87_009021 [Trapa incisa]